MSNLGFGLDEAKALAVRPADDSVWLANFSDCPTVGAVAAALRPIIKNGKDLSDRELVSLVQTAIVTGLDPLIGEIWGLPKYGTFVGIAGWRRKAAEYSALTRDSYSTHFEMLTNEEREAFEIKDDDLAIWCVLEKMSDRKATSDLRIPLLDRGVAWEVVVAEHPTVQYRGLGVLRAVEIETFKRELKNKKSGFREPGNHVRTRAERHAIKQAFGINLPNTDMLSFGDVDPNRVIEMPRRAESLPDMTPEHTAELLAPGTTRLGIKPPQSNGDDIIEGEVSEDGSAEQVASSGGNANGDDLSAKVASTPRPWPAELLRDIINYNVSIKEKDGPTPKAVEGHRGLMVGTLDDLLDGQPGKRLEFLKYVFNVTTSKALRKAQVQAVLNWLLNGDAFSEHAKAEAENVLRQHALNSGQGDMFEVESASDLDEFLGPHDGRTLQERMETGELTDDEIAALGAGVKPETLELPGMPATEKQVMNSKGEVN